MKLNEWLSNLDSKVAKDVEKYLGEVPILPNAAAITSLMRTYDENVKKYKDAIIAMGTDAKTAPLAYDKVIAEIKKVAAQLKDETFGLDAKNKADLKKISDARALYIGEVMKPMKKFEKAKEIWKSVGKDGPADGKIASTSATALPKRFPGSSMSEIKDLYKTLAVKAAKILGPNAKLPDPPAPLDKAVEAIDDVEEDFSRNADSFDTATQEFVNIIVKLKAEARKFNAVIQKTNFGLDLDSPVKLKQAVALRKYYQSNFDSLNAGWDDTLDKLESQLDAMKAETKKIK